MFAKQASKHRMPKSAGGRLNFKVAYSHCAAQFLKNVHMFVTYITIMFPAADSEMLVLFR